MAIIDRVKFDGLTSRDWLVYKYPSENLVYGTQLIVNEGQVAAFLKGGKICDIFLPGTYTLNAGNLPVLNSIVNLPFGSKTPFTAEIYYINTVTKLDLYWGTSDPIQIIDPKYFIRLQIRAFGQMGIKISDYSVFIKELIGSLNKADAVRFDKVIDFYKGILINKVKTVIADIIINQKISALEISAKLDVISQTVSHQIEPEFEKYGFRITNFYIKSINFPKEDFDQINKILEDKAAFEIMGSNQYVTKRSFDVYEGAANNSSGVAGAFAAGGVGLGAGMALSGNLNNVINTSPEKEIRCPKCNSLCKVGTKFCNNCGENLELKKCPHCSTLINSGTKFCQECGQPLDEKVCECGAKLDPKAKFCINCGRKVED